MTLKSGLKVIGKQYVSIHHQWLPINVPQ